ncbi:hypothetical protein FPV67DRAFT_74720 [Lyophyllum atratum]|nr:hypothetical protein FPV67DRAFT_74720 [Lyophyllum atratum]
MHHRALRLLPSTPLSYASTLSFSSILQAAAGRAWVRRSTSGPPLSTRPSPMAHDKSPKIGIQAASKRQKPVRVSQDIVVMQGPHQGCKGSLLASISRKRAPLKPKPSSSSRAPRRASSKHTRSVAYFHPEDIQDSDLESSDPARFIIHPTYASEQSPNPSEDPWSWDDSSIIGTPVGLHVSRTPTGPLVPLAKTAPSLYQNLLHLLSYHNPFPTLPALLDYHDLHPGLRSTRSYNLLVSLALRNKSYGTVPWLLSSMRAASVPGNVETWKLRVRWLIQSGWWDKAWNEVMSTSPRIDVKGKGELKGGFQVSNALPLPVWLEFFQPWKGRTTRRRERARRALDNNTSTPEAPSQSFEPADLYLARYHTLMNNRPTVIPYDLAHTPPKAVYSVASVMLDLEQTGMAVSLTRAYLSSLPPRISSSRARACLDIIHLHIAMGSSHRGLRRFYEARRTMVSLISLHPALRPTSTTLALLLTPLRRAKRCGTVAWNVLRAFKAQWGARTEDRRVRRRVAILAMKEGRMDIVDTLMRSERSARWAHATWKLSQRVVGKAATPRPPRLLRPPARRVFRRNGREERDWCSLMKRVSRRHDRTK